MVISPVGSSAAPSTAATGSETAPSPVTWIPVDETFDQPPPRAKGQLLTVAQLRYCLAENIRLDAGKAALEGAQSSDLSIDAFNRRIEDYNGRCGEFRYRESEMTSAKNAVDASRFTLEREGRERVGR